MKGRTVKHLFFIITTVWIMSLRVSSVDQDYFSGDGLGFEDDEDVELASGSGPLLPSISTLQPGRQSPSPRSTTFKPSSPRITTGAPTVSTQRSRVTSARPRLDRLPIRPDDEIGSGAGDDDWRNPPTVNKTSPPSPPLPTSREDDLDGSSGDDDIIEDPDISVDLPNLGEEIIIDTPSTTRPPVTQTSAPPTRARSHRPSSVSQTSATPTRSRSHISLVSRSSSAPPSTSKSTPVTTTQVSDMIITPEDDEDDDDDEVDNDNQSNKQTLWFFKIFNDPLVLAGIISGAVLAIFCIVLIVMFMIYRMRKKDEGSYALGEPRRAYDIKYTRTTDQEYFA